MNTTELEFAISQLVDGTLPPTERTALEEVLATDADARALLAEYQSLQTVLTRTLPVPEVDYDVLSARISAAVAQEEAPVRHFVMPWIGSPGRLALAASVLLAVGIGIVMLSLNDRPVTTEVTGRVPPTQTPTLVVTGPQVEVAGVPSVQQVTVGPSDPLASNWHYGQAVVSRPSRVLIYSALDPAQDTRFLSY